MKILLVRLSSMGDLVHTLPAVSDLARHCPDIELHWLCEAAFADVARLHPFVRRVEMMQWRKWRKHLFQAAVRREIGSLKTVLRAEGYDAVLDSQGLLKSALFARFAAAPVRGLDWHSAREPAASLFYGTTFAVEKNKDAVWRNRTLFAQAFGYCFEGAPDFGIAVPEAGSGSLKHVLPPQYRVALHAASRDSKLWPEGNWISLLSRLYAADGLPVLLPWGSEAERGRAERLAKSLPAAQVCPRLTLAEAAEMMRHTKSVIGVDTGLLHLANAANRPLVGIYTASDPAKTGVQQNAWSRSIGGIGEMPDVETVYRTLAQCEMARQPENRSHSK